MSATIDREDISGHLDAVIKNFMLELRANGVIEDGIGLEILKYQYHFNLINQSGSFMFSGPC